MRPAGIRASILLLAMGAVALAQQQPLPKPVSPPVPIPGSDSAAPGRSAQTASGELPAVGDTRVAPGTQSAINPFLDDQTVAVARFDLSDVDVNAVRQWVLGAVDELRKTDKEILRAREDVDRELGDAFDAVEKFRSAGARQVYIVASLADLTEERPPALVVPLAQGADRKALLSMLNGEQARVPVLTPADRAKSSSPVAEVVNNAVVYAAPGTIDRLAGLQPAARPDVQKAFASAGRGHIQIAMVPQEDARKLLEKALPKLPEELGGGPVTPVSRGIQWGELTIELPPNPALHLVVQARDAQSALSLEEILDKAISLIEGQKEVPPEARAWKGLLRELRPRQTGERLETDLSGDQTRQVAGVLAATLLRARTDAKRVQTASRLRQLAVAVLSYCNEHQGRLPATLDEQVNTYLGPRVKEVWTDPLRPNQKKPYVYLRLADRLKDVQSPDKSVMLYENHTTWDDGVWVFFADGHGEWVARESDFKQMIDQTRKLNPMVGEMPQ